MRFKKPAYILFIFLIAVLHTLTLTTWLANDVGILENTEGISLDTSEKDSLYTVKRSSSLNASVHATNLFTK